MTRPLRHLAWADDRFFTAIADVDVAGLQARYSAQAWTVSDLLAHIVQGAEWYRYCLTGQKWTEFDSPKTRGDVESLRNKLRGLDESLVHQGMLPDDVLVFEDEDGMSEARRSTLLGQAIVHATEHRAQICAALEAEGYPSPSLDELDLWAFEKWESRS